MIAAFLASKTGRTMRSATGPASFYEQAFAKRRARGKRLASGSVGIRIEHRLKAAD
jgi:hypothetical protein